MRTLWILASLLAVACGDRVSVERAGLPVLGMPYLEFAAQRDVAGMQRSDLLDFRFELTETLAPSDEGSPVAATYYFEREGEQALYEIILQFRSPEEALRHAHEVGKAAPRGERWAGVSEAGLPIRSWTYRDRFMVKATLGDAPEKSILLDSPEGRKLDEAMDELRAAADALR